MHVAVLLLGLLMQDGPVDVTTDEKTEATLGGRYDVHYFQRDGTIEDARNSLMGLPESADDDNLVTGLLELSLDIRLDDDWSAYINIGNLTYGGGTNISLSDWQNQSVIYNDVWIEGRNVLSEDLRVRVGVQRFGLRNRFDDSPFVIDVGGAESAWTGLTPTGTVNSPDRNTLATAGLRLWYDAAIFLKVQAFFISMAETLSLSTDEVLAGLYASAKTSEALTIKLLVALFAGPAKESEIWTVGPGIVWAFHEDWMVAGEVYVQFGESQAGMDKSAFGANVSLRYAGETWWADIAVLYASGDDPTDTDDDAWVSYESVNTFKIVQSDEFGLDWDTNYLLVRAAFEYTMEAGTAIRLDIGWFTLPEPVPGVVNDDQDDLGIEADLSVTHPLTDQVSAYVGLAFLFSSDVLERTNNDREDFAWLGFAGIDLNF